MPPGLPAFEEWLEYSFVYGQSDFSAEAAASLGRDQGGASQVAADEDRDRLDREREAREIRFATLSPIAVAEYLTRLFEDPSCVAGRFSYDRLGDGIWFIFGVASESIAIACQDEVPMAVRQRLIRSIATIYRELFDPMCSRRQRTNMDPDDGRLESAIVMIWDMDVLEHVVFHSHSPPELVECGAFVLESILSCCQSEACIRSALHGVGHAVRRNNSGTPRNEQLVVRLQHAVDALLTTRALPDELRDYALAARSGDVI